MERMLRTLVSLFAIVMLLCSLTAYAGGGKAEISFSVGDDTLMINGESVTVEKPYVVGDGVTLVPLRVITEAFGAKVNWIAESKSIEITYPDVDILLQIDNPVAEVNSKAENLLAAPELTDGGFTMVPLRFISETFGADVSYDDATRQITVVKETSENAATVEGAVNSTYIGDSFYGWHMENPKDMYMDYRCFDGTETSFTYDDNNYIYITVWPVAEDYDFEKDFIQGKSSLASDGYTLVKADKDTSDPDAKSMHLQVRDKYEFLNVKKIVTDKYEINVIGSFETDNTKVKDECIRIMSTFKCVYSDADTYDLSNAVEGYRTFEAEDINLSFKVPENYFMSSNEDSQNEFEFYTLSNDDKFSSVSVNVYSKSDAGSAQQLAEKDYTHNKQLINESIAKFSDGVTVREYEALPVAAYEYNYTIDASFGKYSKRDVFFELGEYVYNITVSFKLPMDDYEVQTDIIINSVKVQEIDADKVGILLRNTPEATGTYQSKVGNLTLEIPNNYYETVEGNDAIYTDPVSGTNLLVQMIPSITSMVQVKAAVKEIENNQKPLEGMTILSSTTETKIGSNKYYTFVMRNESDDGYVYLHQYGTVSGGAMYSIAVACHEFSYSEYSKQN